MRKVVICKTVVPYPEVPRYYIVTEDGRYDGAESIVSLAKAIRQRSTPGGLYYLKNEAPGDIQYTRDDTLPDRVQELTRLSRDEVRDLARTLREG